jgi:hypothetical protein
VGKNAKKRVFDFADLGLTTWLPRPDQSGGVSTLGLFRIASRNPTILPADQGRHDGPKNAAPNDFSAGTVHRADKNAGKSRTFHSKNGMHLLL